MDGYTVKFALATVILCLSVQAAASDFEGESFSLVEPFPGSIVVEFESDDRVMSRRIILGTLKKINNAVQPESSEYIRGNRVAITYEIPDERRTDVVGGFFRDQITRQGQILFECEGRECGSSNYWANSVFDRAILYGPEEDQHYILAKMEGESVYYVATYVAQRGTREIYSHLDIVVAESEGTVIDGRTIESALESQGKYILPAEVDEKTLAAVVDALKDRPAWFVGVVGHDRMTSGETPDDAIERTREMAETLKIRIERAGIDQSRLRSFGVGPLAPMDNEERGRIELVLLNE